MQQTEQPLSKTREHIFVSLCLGAIAIPLLVLIVLIGDVVIDGAERIGWDFLTGYPSRKPEIAGILPALVGSVYVIGLTGIIALPLGVGAAIYLEEYGTDSWLAQIIEVNIANLAGVPSIIYGLLGLELFVRTSGMGRSVIAGACTMALLILPIIIIASREALRTVPFSLREGALALGASRWQTIWQVVLPMAFPGILTGSILAMSRAIGETAPLIMMGALTYIAFLPTGLDSPFTVLPIQIFNWVSRPQHGFIADAAAGIMVLLVTLLLLNALAIYLRNRLQRRIY